MKCLRTLSSKELALVAGGGEEPPADAKKYKDDPSMD
jgi:hypothetical protein